MPPIRKLHALSGLFVGAFILFHAWEYSSAVDGRRVFSARMASTSAGTMALVLELLLVFLPLALHAGTGIVLAVQARGQRDPGTQATVGLRRLQLVSGLVLLVFVVVHVGHLWAPRIAGAIGTDALYEVLLADLGVPVVLITYVIGVTAACLHLCYGLIGAFAALRPFAGDGQVSALKILAVLVALGLWVHAINTLGWFATGAGVFWGGP